MVILDGNHRYEVFVMELGEPHLWARLVCPIDATGKMMTVGELALLQGARNSQHALTGPICMFCLFTL